MGNHIDHLPDFQTCFRLNLQPHDLKNIKRIFRKPVHLVGGDQQLASPKRRNSGGRVYIEEFYGHTPSKVPNPVDPECHPVPVGFFDQNLLEILKPFRKIRQRMQERLTPEAFGFQNSADGDVSFPICRISGQGLFLGFRFGFGRFVRIRCGCAARAQYSLLPKQTLHRS